LILVWFTNLNFLFFKFVFQSFLGWVGTGVCTQLLLLELHLALVNSEFLFYSLLPTAQPSSAHHSVKMFKILIHLEIVGFLFCGAGFES
jgi:hypothetical protein